MCNKLKIGLTRCRLFDFQNCVTFVGEYAENFEEKELQKAMKMLFVRYPVITAQIELNDVSEAFLQLEKYEPKITFLESDVNEFVSNKKNNAVNFNERLFEFYVINKKILVIFSHTIVSDAKSLLLLAKELLSYYNKETVLIEPKPVKLFGSEAEIPLEAESFVADRVTEVLNNSWLEKSTSFTFEDYEKAKKEFVSKNQKTECADFVLDDALSLCLKKTCDEMKVDFSSAVAFGLFKTLSELEKASKKNGKMEIQVDRRPYFIERELYSVGPFNGTVSVELPKNNLPLNEQLKAFHKNYYKKFTESFNAFYNEVFLSKLEPAFLDSMFMYKAGLYSKKPTKKLANLYGCEQKFVLGFAAYNLKQEYWSALSTFCHVSVNEPHKTNKNVSATLVMGEKNTLHIEWDTSNFTRSQIESVFEKSIAILKQL